MAFETEHAVSQRIWLIFPIGVEHPADRERRGKRVGPCWWREAVDEGARRLGLLRDECDWMPVEERAERAA